MCFSGAVCENLRLFPGIDLVIRCYLSCRDWWCALKSPFIFTTSKTWSWWRLCSTRHPTPQVQQKAQSGSGPQHPAVYPTLLTCVGTNPQFFNIFYKTLKIIDQQELGLGLSWKQDVIKWKTKSFENFRQNNIWEQPSYLFCRSLCSFDWAFQLVPGVPWQCHCWGGHCVRCQQPGKKQALF